MAIFSFLSFDLNILKLFQTSFWASFAVLLVFQIEVMDSGNVVIAIGLQNLYIYLEFLQFELISWYFSFQVPIKRGVVRNDRFERG